MLKISCLLLAAGCSSRMGGKNKLMLEVNGVSLVERTFMEIQKAKLQEVIVVTGFQKERIEKVLTPMGARIVHNNSHASGMHSSIKTGLNALSDSCDAFFICLADQPFLEHSILQSLVTVANKHPEKIYAPFFQGKRGNPVLISSKFIHEIMNEPDGDYGCSYLLKRHQQDVIPVPVESTGILIDMDTPADYERVQENIPEIDPVKDFYSRLIDLRHKRNPFATATVIEVMGSASARTGSKAIFSSEGKNLSGWVGGGCAERFIGEECVTAILEGKPRTVLADLDDEIFGLGVACGGKMKVFIDPVLPMETVNLPFSLKYKNETRTLAGFYGWEVVNSEKMPSPQSAPELILSLVNAIGSMRKTTQKSLREVKPVPAEFTKRLIERYRNVVIVGRTRITEALARHFTLLDMNVTAIGPDVREEDYPSTVKCHCLDTSYEEIQFHEGDIVIIASHTSQDPHLVEKAIDAKASYVGMIGSLKRSEEVLNYLQLKHKKINAPLFIPAGLDIDARNPDEIALSVAGEIVSLMERT